MGMMEIISRITGLILFLLLSPLLFGISFFNLLVQGRPIIFRQERIGKNFKPFIIYKFRTMNNGNSELNFTTAKSGNITRWGKFLRKTKLDELPQFVNVIKGDMRFIGPRPEVPEFVDEDSFSFLNTIKPGLSGYSSILFRSSLTFSSLSLSSCAVDSLNNLNTPASSIRLRANSFALSLSLSK